ncbi:MAG: sigma-70 family RNA polymerase sigma factor [Oscillospiraceae bacterium]|jgi:RNA polymerase sporulation-specific sigma factor|nr:sigma-70 family RNA polymerase sigma factor [Oscillospiraceae bacterium]
MNTVSTEERLLQENAGLIWSVVRHYYGRGVEPDDLYQLGCLGFIKAVRAYDPSYGTKFSTYAVPKIASEIRRFMRDDGSVKVSRAIKERAFKVAKSRRELEQSLERDPTLSEVAALTGCSPEDVAECDLALSPVDSLQREALGEDSATLENTLADFTLEDKLVERVALKQAIEALPERERAVIFLRYWRGLTQDASSKLLGVSQVQISRLERKGVATLRALLGGEL